MANTVPLYIHENRISVPESDPELRDAGRLFNAGMQCGWQTIRFINDTDLTFQTLSEDRGVLFRANRLRERGIASICLGPAARQEGNNLIVYKSDARAICLGIWTPRNDPDLPAVDLQAIEPYLAPQAE